MKLSVVIITYNEEKNIARCIDSVRKVADEIIVLDSFSNDATEKIAKRKGARFFQHAFDGHIEQKNRAITYASNEWILSLDADEALDETLTNEILRVKENWQADGYSMNRMTNYCGAWIKHGGWYPDVKVRLWSSKKGKWGGENPHDKFIMHDSAHVKHLKGDILHYSFSTHEQHDEQIAYFTDISSKALFDRGKRVGPLRPLLAGFVKFVRDYLLRRGFLDGTAGFTIASKSARAKYQKYAKLRQLHASS